MTKKLEIEDLKSSLLYDFDKASRRFFGEKRSFDHFS